jgi:spore germination protein (amino acid permease)
MMKNEKISILQATMLIIATVGILDHVIIIPILFQQAERDSWVSVTLAAIPFLIWCPVLLFVMRRSGQQHLYVWLQQNAGPFAARVIVSFMAVHLFFMTASSLRDTASWSNTTYLPHTPNTVLVFAFLLIAWYAAFSGLHSIAIVNGILLPFVVILGFFVMTSNIPHKDYTLLFPLFEHGYGHMIKGMAYAGAGFSEIIYLVYMQHHLRSRMNFAPLLITGIILVELTLSPLTGAIAIFGPEESSRMRYPAYEQWRMITFEHYVEHVDFLSIYQWFVGGFIRIALGLFLIPDLLRVPKGRKRTLFMIVLFFLIAAAAEAPISDLMFVKWLTAVYLPGSLIFIVLLSLVLAAVSLLNRKKKVGL